MKRVLFVEDEPQLLRAMRITLRARGYEVRTAVDGGHALSEAAAFPPDLVVLDLGLPDMDGIDVIRGLRGWTTAPIIVLSGRTSGQDKIASLDAGADDYVTKPFSVEELLARMRAVTRRVIGTETGPTADIGAYRVDFAAKSVDAIEPRATAAGQDSGAGAAAGAAGGSGGEPAGGGGGEPAGGVAGEAVGGGSGGDRSGSGAGRAVHLTPTEWRLLEALVRNPGKLVSTRMLVSQVWGPGYSDDTSSLRLYMNRLRRKLEPDPARPRYLTTEAGMGYRYQP